MSKSITTIEEYQELARLADTAEECLYSLRFGSHAFLMKVLREKYGITTDRLGAIKQARRLCNEFLDGLKYAEIGDEQ